MLNKLFVAGLSYSATDSAVEQLFAQYGKVLSAKVIMDKYTGQGKGFGFVEMSTPEEAKIAMDKLNNSQFLERTLVVKEAKPQENRTGGFQRGNDNKQDRW
jgi:RNA recognition motif-containing protein